MDSSLFNSDNARNRSNFPVSSLVSLFKSSSFNCFSMLLMLLIDSEMDLITNCTSTVFSSISKIIDSLILSNSSLGVVSLIQLDIQLKRKY